MSDPVYCPVCEGDCELEEARAEAANPPLRLVNPVAWIEHQDRLGNIIRRLEKEHAA